MKVLRAAIKSKSKCEAESLTVAKAFDQGKRVKPISETYFESKHRAKIFFVRSEVNCDLLSSPAGAGLGGISSSFFYCLNCRLIVDPADGLGIVLSPA